MVFFEVNLISYIALVFSKTVVDLSGGFADVKGLTFGADDTSYKLDRRYKLANQNLQCTRNQRFCKRA